MKRPNSEHHFALLPCRRYLHYFSGTKAFERREKIEATLIRIPAIQPVVAKAQEIVSDDVMFSRWFLHRIDDHTPRKQVEFGAPKARRPLWFS